MKLVVDTNVLLSGVAWSGAASLLVDSLLAAEASLCISDAILAELTDVLHREKFRNRLAERGQNATAILARFREIAQHVDPLPLPVPALLRDPDDIHVLACAMAASADAIVTGDGDLLSLKEFEGIPIIGISEALRLLSMESQ